MDPKMDEEDLDRKAVFKILLVLTIFVLMSIAFLWCLYRRNVLGILAVITVVVAVVIGFYVNIPVSVATTIANVNVESIAQNAATNIERFRGRDKTAFVVGYTGETGKELVKELAKTKIFSKVTLIGRRNVQLSKELLGQDFNVQRVIDFEKLEESADVFKGHDVGYSCLGASLDKVGREGFLRVDRDYVLKIAELSRKGGTTHFNLISSQGADKSKDHLYFYMKGVVEEEMKSVGFKRLSIYRPGLLMCDRNESRGYDMILQKLLTPFQLFSPGLVTTPTTTLAKAMVHVTVAPSKEPFELYDGKAIHKSTLTA
ncbi:oxidoreductase HTATIP2-like [Amphiura filiformis]|uniref:oxidoreductase HTATIP2-like n=1 Tax=Amphiura filiformis TaxID=82378 RepID=UPI003B2230BA